jgi:hypothetical protein
MPGVFPHYLAPVVRNAPDGICELAMLRWGKLQRALPDGTLRIVARGERQDSRVGEILGAT